MTPEPRFQFVTDIFTDNDSSLVPDVAFSPDGQRFAVTYQNNNEVRLYDTTSRDIIRVYVDGALEAPHGVVMTDRFLVVSNKMDPDDRPASLVVFDYRQEDPTAVCIKHTPVDYLREGHSMDIHKNRLLVTYCGKGKSAVGCFEFDQDSGEIGELLSLCEDWFSHQGKPKGVSFNEAGDAFYVTVSSVRAIPSSLPQKLDRMRWLLSKKQGVKRVSRIAWSKFSDLLQRGHMRSGEDDTQANGIALFALSASGAISESPLDLQLHEEYCRMENIHTVGRCCVIADPMKGEVAVSDLASGKLPDPPRQIITENLSFPHSARLSPCGSYLAIADYGLRVENQKPQWHQFTGERSDKVSLFCLAPDPTSAAS